MRIGWERDFLRESVSRFFYTEVVTPKRIHIMDQQMELFVTVRLTVHQTVTFVVPKLFPNCGAASVEDGELSGCKRLK